MSEASKRPDPDALLRKLQAEAKREGRGRLRIFFGFAPGVGKTFRMLEAARELVDQSIDVAVGAVETHGRYDTESMLLGLELLPRQQLEYRGRTLAEFDLDGTLARKPKVVLLDELAHTNAPGSRHAKRWQDVIELLEAGIDVYTTLNVQHIESLNDVVAQITRVQVRETVPDSMLERADEVELVDISPEELLTRLREGKVYFPEQAERAAQHFFQPGNLLALRELALRRTAERVDADVLAHREREGVDETWQSSERILVCVGPAPASARLVRTGRRMAAGLRAPWVTAYVESTVLAPSSKDDRMRLDAHLRLAESLGATVVRLTGPRVSAAVLDYARKHNVTRIILGKPTHTRLRDFLRGSLLDEVVRGSGNTEVHVVSGDADAPPLPEPDRSTRPGWDPVAYGFAVGLVALGASLAWLLRGLLAAADIVMLYLAVISLVAVRFGRGPSLLASALSVAAYDFFFVPPFFTFAVGDQRHLLTFVTMFAVSLLISGLMLRIRRQEEAARNRETRTAALYALSRELGTALDEVAATSVLARHASDVFHCAAAVIVVQERRLGLVASAGGDVSFEAAEQGVAQWVLDNGRPAGLGTDTLPGARIACFPIRSGEQVLGALALAPRPGQLLDLEARHSLEAFLRQGGLAIERARLAELAKAAALRARTEEMRSALLSAVSHDLRTPLAVIMGAATALSDRTAHVSPATRDDLLETICEEADRLERLVRNLLDMTRVESGSLKPKCEWMPLDEIVGTALSRLAKKLGEDRSIRIELPDSVPLISVDPVLFEQVFVNLFENVAKYTPAGSPVEVVASRQSDSVVIEVRDRGPGLPAEGEQIFERFFRGRHQGVPGVGLGLAICKGVVEAHGGSIRAENRPGGGATFRITLPIVGSAPSVPTELPQDAGAAEGAA